MKQEEKKDNIISCGVNDSALDSLQYLASLRCVPLDNYMPPPYVDSVSETTETEENQGKNTSPYVDSVSETTEKIGYGHQTDTGSRPIKNKKIHHKCHNCQESPCFDYDDRGKPLCHGCFETYKKNKDVRS